MKLKALSMTSAIPGSAQPTELTSQLGVGHSEFGQFFLGLIFTTTWVVFVAAKIAFNFSS